MGELLGHQLLPRQIAQLGRAHWQDVELVKMVATALAESQGDLGSFNDNPNGTRDCGLMQINIDGDEIGTSVETALRTTSELPAEYEKVAIANVEAAYKLYEMPFDSFRLRLWEPWASYTEGWATFPGWWIWHQNAQGQSVGPWERTGRYIHRAITGVANYHLLIAKDKTLEQCIALATTYAEHFGVAGSVGVSKGFVAWQDVPAEPTEPPSNGVGNRPLANTGA